MSKPPAEGGRNEVLDTRRMAEFENAARLIRENKPENLPDPVKRRLDLDLMNNCTADYSRINLTQMFAVFGCQVPETITLWRINKILDGIAIANSEFGICGGVSPDSIPTKIYEEIKRGNAEEKTWDLKLTNPDNPDEIITNKKASLADFAYFVDLLNTNKSLGIYKVDVNRLAYNYFMGRELTAEISDKNGVKESVNLEDQKINPRDDYGQIDVDGYLETVGDVDVQIGLQMVQLWRFNSDGHRELGGQAYAIEDEKTGETTYIPLSGRMAAEVTLGDLQKGEKGGMNGQPQELGEMDEKKTGAIVRFRLADLKQRRRGGNVRDIGKTQRLGKAMVGVTLNEDAYSQIRNEKVKNKEGVEESKKVVYLCGKNLESKQIIAMHAHHDDTMKKVRGYGLSDDEAADLTFTDVFAPCIINNENDWLDALARTYGVGKQGSSSLINNKDNFGDFVLKIKCRDWKNPDGDYPITWLTFRGMTGPDSLREYVAWRVKAGHIDQPGAKQYATADAIGQNAVGDDRYSEYIFEKIEDTKEKKIRELLLLLLGHSAGDDIAKYVRAGGEMPEFEQLIKVGDKTKRKEILTFDDYITPALMKKIKEEDGDVLALLAEIYDIDWERQNADLDKEVVAKGLLATLRGLSESERRKLL